MVMAHRCASCDTADIVLNQLPELLAELEAVDCIPMNTIGQRRALRRRLPERGVYVFYDAGTPAYVGRSNRMTDRVLEHGRPGGNARNAPVAARIAANEIVGDAEENFPLAAEVVRQMTVKAVAIECRNLQAVFEVYAHLALGRTRYNDFDVN